jgi:hypothetical protein
MLSDKATTRAIILAKNGFSRYAIIDTLWKYDRENISQVDLGWLLCRNGVKIFDYRHGLTRQAKAQIKGLVNDK